MRIILFLAFIGLFIPQLLFAQFNNFKPGAYILDKSRQVQHTAQLKLKNDKLLIAKDKDGKTSKLTPKDIYSFKIEQQRYRTASGFEINSGFSGEIVDEVFVALLDSGQVLLMRYEYTVKSPTSMGAGSFPQAVQLLRGAKSYSTPTVIRGNNSAKENAAIKSMLGAYVTARPDLTKLLTEGKIWHGNLQAFVHALNTGQPFK
ncbi:hypothetical protein AM218_03400 [Hymenobacter sp. DG25A]|nr:hypothetical protein AM218_03400 [Hymenobacter sp. DG25A]